MHLRLLLSVFLCSSTMYAMELTTVSTSGGICIITDDLLTTAICSRLDRPARDALRCTNKKYFELILSQDKLNKNYKEVYALKDETKIIY